ncbi:arginine-trna-protein transferase [Fusarium langsethiae]|uniref:Arginine-trna-protein transferase n=1 Tax=Fusarium langsethiae TaxID=179993 RepID=A0A0N0V6L1_FUSLA|nr:arginine-trna-protein transferase [Fusarium langsethiae]
MEPNGMRIPGDASLQYEYLSPIGYSKSSRCGYCGSRGKSQSKREQNPCISPYPLITPNLSSFASGDICNNAGAYLVSLYT